MEQTLFIYKEVDIYKIPPRPAAGGHRSGDWRVADKIFTARLKVVAVGDALEVRLEDPNSGELFGVCPVPRGQLHLVVESATDSSRNFVLRLEDAASKRHAFVGMSFGDRSAAFDFNVALTDHEKRLQREAEFSRIQSAADPLAAAQQILPEAAAMYKHQDLSLKEGETIRIAMKKPGTGSAESGGGSSGGGFLSRLGNLPQASSSAPGGLPKLVPLAPPPADLSGPPAPTVQSSSAAPRPAADPFAPRMAAATAPASSAGSSRGNVPGGSAVLPSSGLDLLGLDDPFAPITSSVGGSGSGPAAGVHSAVAAFENFRPFAPPKAAQAQPNKPEQQPAAEPGWATFE